MWWMAADTAYEELFVVNWINNVVRPKITGLLSTAKRDVPDNLWVKCPETGQMVFYKDLEANQFVVPGSNYHMRMGADQRLRCPHVHAASAEGKVETVTQRALSAPHTARPEIRPSS